MPLLEDQRQEAFAQNVSKGMSDVQAYLKAYKCAHKTALTNAWRLRDNEGVVSRIDELRTKSETKLTLSMQERREFLARCVRLNLHEIDLDKDGDLVQEITRIEGTQGKAGVEKMKLPGKRECVMADAELAGDLEHKVTLSGIVQHQHTITEERRSELMERRQAAIRLTNGERDGVHDTP